MTEETKKWIKASLSVALVLGSVLPFGYLGRPTEMGIALLAGGIAAAFLNIDKIQRVKGAGFEAEMRKAVEEVYATTGSLRQLAKVMLRSTLHMLTMLGRLTGSSEEHQKHVFRSEIERLGKELGLGDDQDLRCTHELFFQYHAWDYFGAFVEQLRNAIPDTTYERLRAMRDYSGGSHPSRKDIEAVLGNDIDLDALGRERLEDYIHYVQYRTLRHTEAL